MVCLVICVVVTAIGSFRSFVIAIYFHGFVKSGPPHFDVDYLARLPNGNLVEYFISN